jgi:DNA polymerase-1
MRNVTFLTALSRNTMQDAPFPAVQLSLPLQVDARAANNWDEAH